MKKIHLLLSFFILEILTFSFAYAEMYSIPPLINYQGTLANENGQLSSGYMQLTFSIFDSANKGNKIWGPQVFSKVYINNGLFNIILGPSDKNGNSIANAFNSSECFLSISIGDEINEITPRQRILSVPYALNGVPPGSIIMWSGSLDAIPDGWILCDGNNGTPDLRERFIVGVSEVYKVGTTGGSATHDHGGATGNHTLSTDEIPAHTHGVNRNASPGSPGGYGFPLHSYNSVFPFETRATGGGKAHSHDISENNHLPPYYALAFIKKI